MATPLVRDMMSSPLSSIPPTMCLPVINRIMRGHAIRHLPVVDRERRLGIISPGDIRELSALLDKVLARDIMRRDVSPSRLRRRWPRQPSRW